MTDEHIIKKYANRRLYDTALSRYVTLDDIRRLVIEGRKFRVIDAKTEADITRSILLQIIVEQEEQGNPILGVNLLERIIRFYGDALQGYMGGYLERSLDVFMKQQEIFHKQMASLMENAPMSAMTEIAQRNMAAWQGMQEAMLKAYQAGQDGKGEPRESDAEKKG
jgi:polyhydroxyalkanoate synthesis repressor PhaR